jgi:polyhydroxybutyrate depolymerase
VIVLHGNHPEATGQMMRDWTTFDEQPGAFGDVAFLRALIDTLAGRHGTHPDRAVVAGVSNGAFMGHRIALEASEKAAVFDAAEEICRFAEPLLVPADSRRL